MAAQIIHVSWCHIVAVHFLQLITGLVGPTASPTATWMSSLSY